MQDGIIKLSIVLALTASSACSSALCQEAESSAPAENSSENQSAEMPAPAPDLSQSKSEKLVLPPGGPAQASSKENPEIIRSIKDMQSPDGTVTITRKFVPKFKERIKNLAEQIQMAQSKGFIEPEKAKDFLAEQAKLLQQEEAAAKNNFPKEELDKLETAITVLNGNLFKAMRKNDPVKPGPAESEVNDPNLIPAYPDPELQPGSGIKP